MSKKPVALIAVVLITVGVTSLFAQTSELAGDTLMRALIDEIRMLRVSLQKNSAYEIRSRLLIDRARLQQETIREISREVEGSAEYFRNMEEPGRDMDMTTEMTMAAAPATAVPMSAEDQRRMQEQQKEAMERRRAMEARHREQMRVRYQRMEQRLQEERDKLRAIEDELAEIQRELTK
jgi:hypothetical protein